MAICVGCGRYVDAPAGDDALCLCEQCINRELANRKNPRQRIIDDMMNNFFG